MDLISSKDTLDFLTKSAPRPWVKKMLMWMIYQNELGAYFRAGRIVPKVSLVGFFVQNFGIYPPKPDRDKLVREQFEADIAEKLINLSETDYVEDDPIEWTFDDEPHPVGAGHFVYAETIDWEAGNLEDELFSFEKSDEDIFWDQEEHLISDYKDPQYSISLKGLCFVRDAIEMLQPGVELAPEKREPVESRARPGRPRVWDWDGATLHLLKLAQHPDGLPTGPGAQAHVERMIAEWFVETIGNAPSVSQVRQHAARIMKALKTPESR